MPNDTLDFVVYYGLGLAVTAVVAWVFIGQWILLGATGKVAREAMKLRKNSPNRLDQARKIDRVQRNAIAKMRLCIIICFLGAVLWVFYSSISAGLP